MQRRPLAGPILRLDTSKQNRAGTSAVSQTSAVRRASGPSGWRGVSHRGLRMPSRPSHNELGRINTFVWCQEAALGHPNFIRLKRLDILH